MYWLHGRMHGATEPLLRDELARAHAQHDRPRCTCTDPGAPMYIARSHEGFVIKRMPCTGHLHAPGCPHHARDSDKPDETAPQAAIQRDPVTGEVRISAAFAMTKITTGTSPAWPRDRISEHLHERLALRDFVLYLWTEAELATWRPSFAGKRNWAVVRHHLLRAAANVSVNGIPLAHALFIPEPFSVARADEIRARRLDRIARFLGHSQARQRRMLLIGEVKKVATVGTHCHAVIKHLPDTVFRLPQARSPRPADHRQGWIDAQPAHQILCATFYLDSNMDLNIEQFQLIPMSANWLPEFNEPAQPFAHFSRASIGEQRRGADADASRSG